MYTYPYQLAAPAFPMAGRPASPFSMLADRTDQLEGVVDLAGEAADVLLVLTGQAPLRSLSKIASKRLLKGAVGSYPGGSKAVSHGIDGIWAAMEGVGGLRAARAAARVADEADGALAAAAPARGSAGLLNGLAGALGTVEDVLDVLVGGFTAAAVVAEDGAAGLITTARGRGGVLDAVGGMLLMSSRPELQLMAAATMAVAVANDVGLLSALDGGAAPRMLMRRASVLSGAMAPAGAGSGTAPGDDETAAARR